MEPGALSAANNTKGGPPMILVLVVGTQGQMEELERTIGSSYCWPNANENAGHRRSE